MKRRRVIWLILWIISIVGISFYGGAVSYGLFFAMTLLPVVSLVYLLCVYFRFKIYQEVESRTMVSGQLMPYYFVVRNEDLFGFAAVKVHLFSDFSYAENMEENIEYELMPGDTFTYHTNIMCKYRGEYEVGVKEVVVTDFFRIFRLKYPVPSTIKAIVSPRLIELSTLVSLPELTAAFSQTSAGDSLDVVVRDYADGDSMGRIHWRLSAKEQKLKVRNEIGEETKGLTLLLDTRRYHNQQAEYLPLENKMLEVYLALGMFLAKGSKGFQSYYFSQGSVCRSGAGDMRGFEGFCSEVSSVIFGEIPFADMLQEFVACNPAQENGVVIAVVHEINDAVWALAEKLVSAGTMVLFYVVTDEDMDAYLRESNSRRKVVVVPTDSELEGVL